MIIQKTRFICCFCYYWNCWIGSHQPTFAIKMPVCGENVRLYVQLCVAIIFLFFSIWPLGHFSTMVCNFGWGLHWTNHIFFRNHPLVRIKIRFLIFFSISQSIFGFESFDWNKRGKMIIFFALYYSINQKHFHISMIYAHRFNELQFSLFIQHISV